MTKSCIPTGDSGKDIGDGGRRAQEEHTRQEECLCIHHHSRLPDSLILLQVVPTSVTLDVHVIHIHVCHSPCGVMRQKDKHKRVDVCIEICLRFHIRVSLHIKICL